MDNIKYTIGIDIGGTKASIGIITEDGIVKDLVKIPTKAGNCEQTCKEICTELNNLLLRNCLQLNDICSIGVGVPGTVDNFNNIAVLCPNLKWTDEQIGSYFKKHGGFDIILAQDTHAGAVAELILGYGKSISNFICVAIGTGVSCGIIVNGKLLRGFYGTAGELGDMVMVPNGIQCNCGNKGCLERYFSGVGISALASEKFNKELTTKQVFDMVRENAQGAHIAKEIIDDGLKKLALGISHMVNTLSPQAIIVSGGMCHEDELILKPLQKYINEFSYRIWVEKNPENLFVSNLGSNAPLIGAGLLNKIN